MAQNKFLREDATMAALTVSDLPAFTVSGIPSLTQSDFISGIVKAPLNQDYRVIEKIPFAATLTQFTGKTSTGSLQVVLKINTTTVTGSIVTTLSTTQTSVNPSGANTAASGDTVVITASSVTSPGDFSFAIQFTRTLA